MNKKIFAALASATMALSATGSLAVFAADFEDESSVLPGQPSDVTEITWNEDNFGDLVNLTTATGGGIEASSTITLTEGEDVSVEDLEKITAITTTAGVENVKGLQYFTGLTSFDASSGITNTSLDFSNNTNLETLKVKDSSLAELTLPESYYDEDLEEDVYSLTTLELTDTILTNLDLTTQPSLTTVTIAGGLLNSLNVSSNNDLETLSVTNTELVNIELPTSKKSKLISLTLSNNKLEAVDLGNFIVNLTKLDLSNNALNAIDLKKFASEVPTSTDVELDISNNHIGALDVKGIRTTGTNSVTLAPQVFFVAKDVATVNLVENIEGLDPEQVNKVDNQGSTFDEDTGILTLKNPAFYVYTPTNGKQDYTEAMTVAIVKANPMHRLYNPNSGEHFYTADQNENDALVELGWQNEGIGWVAPLKGETGNKPVYRLYNPNAGDHHYTMNETEKNILVSIGWKDEGIGWYSFNPTGGSKNESINSLTFNLIATPLYREYNPNAKAAGAHNYTLSGVENDFLVSVGWLQEGMAWNAMK